MMPNVGPMELLIVLILALVVFGPKKLPELGRSLGHGMREFKTSLTEKGEPAPKQGQLEAGSGPSRREQKTEELPAHQP